MKKIYTSIILAFVFCLNIFAQDVPTEQKVLITKIGATWCPSCGLAAWDNFSELTKNFAGEAVLLAIHPSSSSALHSAASRDLQDNLPQAWGQPLFYVNRTKYSTNEIMNGASMAIAASRNENPLANTGLEPVTDGERLSVAAKVKFFEKSTGQYFLSLLVIEDEVVANQASRGAAVSHKKILRKALFDGTFGQEIHNGLIEKNTEFTYNASIDLGEQWNADNLEVAAILWKLEGETYEYVNANIMKTSVGVTTSINLLEKQGVTMNAQPTILKNTTQIKIKAPKKLSNIHLAVYNMAGQEIKSIYKGDIDAGEHYFSLEKGQFNSGVFFLRMEKDGAVLSEKIVVE